MKIKIYGSRGSVPFYGRNRSLGGNTACVGVEAFGHTLVLDCGSGLMQLYKETLANQLGGKLSLDLLISHLHMDHIIGLSSFPPLFDRSADVRIHTKSRGPLPLAEQVLGVFKPPYWPVDYAKISAARFLAITSAFEPQTGIRVIPFDSEHEDVTTAFRVEADKTLVYLLDYETDPHSPRYRDLVTFCENADAVIFDATYLPEDYPAKRGWGHATYEEGIILANDCHCKKMIFSHFSQDYSDEIINSIADRAEGFGRTFFLAYDGMVMDL